MKVVHLVTSLEVGGAQRVRLELVRKLIEMGHDPDDHLLAYFKSGPMKKKFENIGVETHKLSGSFFRYGPAAFMDLKSLIRSFKPDIVHSQLWMANLFAKLACTSPEIKLICDLHCMPSTQGFFKTFCDRFLPVNADRYVAVCRAVADAFKKCWPLAKIGDGKAATGKTVVIKNGVDSNKFKFSFGAREDLREFLRIDEDCFVLGGVGRLEKEKSFDYLIKAFKKFCQKVEEGQKPGNLITVDDLRLVIVGNGSQEGDLKRLANSLGLSEKVIFSSTTHGMYKYYSLFDCMAISSKAEGLSVALLEGLFSGLPVISVSGKGDEHEVIKDGENGHLVGFGKTDEVAEKVYQVFKKFDPEFRERPSLIGQEFEVETMAKKYQTLYKEVLEVR